MLLFNKKKLLIILIYISFFIAIPIIKNGSRLIEKKIETYESQIFSLAGKDFNIGSPKHLGEIIYNELKIAKLKKTRKGSLATNAKVLEDLADKGHEFTKLILEWRQLTKLKRKRARRERRKT